MHLRSGKRRGRQTSRGAASRWGGCARSMRGDLELVGVVLWFAALTRAWVRGEVRTRALRMALVPLCTGFACHARRRLGVGDWVVTLDVTVNALVCGWIHATSAYPPASSAALLLCALAYGCLRRRHGRAASFAHVCVVQGMAAFALAFAGAHEVCLMGLDGVWQHGMWESVGG